MNRAAIVRILCFLVTLAACGSGSSGFDPAVSLSPEEQTELDIIESSVSQQSCSTDPKSGLEVCGSNTTAAPGAPAVDGVSNDAGVSIRGGIQCAAGLNGCAFALHISPQGFQAGSDFLAVVRPMDFSLPWRTATGLFAPDPVDTTRLRAELVTTFEPGTNVVIAILSYPPRAPVPDVGPFGLDVEVLTHLIAARADVITDVPLLPPGG